jgi:glycosyltransferase involved in cell wall biosynthesis
MNGNELNHIPLFTVILSGYQTEPYLRKALDSIANQTFHDFEAICYVEECTDRSLEICHAMAERDPRFKVATGPKSGGVGATRNYGIDHASGQYLIILDGDDWLAEDMMEKLAAKLERTGSVDVLSFIAVTTKTEDVDPTSARKLTNFSANDQNGTFSGLDAIRKAGRNGGQFHAYTVLSIYRTEFLREHRLYQQRGVMEDFEWTPRVWFYAKRMAYLDEVFYFYRRRANSLTTEASSRIIHHLTGHIRSLLAFANAEQVPADIITIWSNQWLSIFYWFMFHPVTSAKITDADREQVLSKLFDRECRAQFLTLFSHVSRPKRLALPLIRLAAKGFIFPARFYFRCFYYPLVGMKGEKTNNAA